MHISFCFFPTTYPTRFFCNSPHPTGNIVSVSKTYLPPFESAKKVQLRLSSPFHSDTIHYLWIMVALLYFNIPFMEVVTKTGVFKFQFFGYLPHSHTNPIQFQYLLLAFIYIWCHTSISTRIRTVMILVAIVFWFLYGNRNPTIATSGLYLWLLTHTLSIYPNYYCVKRLVSEDSLLSQVACWLTVSANPFGLRLLGYSSI